MARTKVVDATPLVKLNANTPELEAFLGSGYGGMTKEDALRIIKERDANPAVWPFEEYRKAKAFLAALAASPQVISKRKPWQINGRQPK